MVRNKPIKALVVTSNNNLSDLVEQLFSEVKSYQFESKRKKLISSALKELRSGQYKICFIDREFKEADLLISLKEMLLFSCRTPLIFIISEHEAKIQAEILQTNVLSFSVKKTLDAELLKHKIDLAIDADAKSAERIQDELLYENANDLIYLLDLDGNFLSVNTAAERVLGYSREELLKLNIKQLLAPESIQSAYELLATTSLKKQGQTIVETICIAKEGRRITLEINKNSVYKNGVLFAVQGIARDITERKRSEYIALVNEATLRELLENAPIGYHELDKEGRFIRVNQSELDLLGYQENEMLGRFVWEFITNESSRESILRKLGGEKTAVPYKQSLLRKDGSAISVLINDKLIENEAGTITGMLTTVQNITEQYNLKEVLTENDRQYRLMGEAIRYQVWIGDPEGNVVYVNEHTLKFFGKSLKEVVDAGWQNLTHPDDLEALATKFAHSLAAGEDLVAEFRMRRYDGKYVWLEGRAAPEFDSKGNIIRWLGVNNDITERKQNEAKLSHIAGHDALTNLPNRAKFINYLECAVKQSESNAAFQFSVLFLDLDRFKVINDSFGHSVGDRLLIEIAKRLKACIRPKDILARLGGDEFTILLRRINHSTEAVCVANRILEELSKPFKINNQEVFTTASIGIIVSDKLKRSPEELLRDADTTMYRAKAAGKSRYEIFDDEMHLRNMHLMRMETDLWHAIERKEFRVFYQPIIELSNGRILEFEALIRWQHPQYGLVPPNDFIPIAEETGLIISIGKWVLEEACRQTVEWQSRFRRHKHLGISVNLSAKQLLHPNIVAHVKEALEYTLIDPSCLKLEVTESMVMENGDKSLAVIKEFHTLGTSISTDDFGTGYSSLSYLHNFPFSRLKIDRSFIGKMEKDLKSETIVRTILMLGQNLEIGTVAEGIENRNQLGKLRSFGCDLGQGYLFSKPVAAAEAGKLLQKGIEINISEFERNF